MIDHRDLTNLTDIKRSLALLMENYDADRICDQKYRSLVYGFQTLSSVARVEAEARIEERLIALEAARGNR